MPCSYFGSDAEVARDGGSGQPLMAIKHRVRRRRVAIITVL